MPSRAIVRTLLSAAAFLALVPVAPLQGQRITFGGLRWGLPADSVRPRLESLGWRFTGTSEHGDPIFRLGEVGAQAVIANGRLVRVNVVHPTTAAQHEARLRFIVDSLTTAYGPPSGTSEHGTAWEGSLSSLGATSDVFQDGQSAAVTVMYVGPGAELEQDRRAGKPEPFPALPEGWIELARSSDRRMSIDTASITAPGRGVYRAGIRFDLLEPQTNAGQRYDAITYERDHDCTGRRMRVSDVVLHLQGQPVKTVGDGSWTPARPDTNQGMELDLACELAVEYFDR